MRRIIVTFLLTVIMLQTCTFGTCAWYTPGDNEYMLKNDDCVSTENAVVSGKGSIETGSGGGYAVFNAFVPFRMKEIRFNYTATEDIPVNVDVDIFPYQIVFKADEKTAVCPLDAVQGTGEHIFKLSFGGQVKIESVCIVEKPMTGNDFGANMAAFSDEQKLIHTAVIINELSSAILVNGATRYIDNNDIGKKPKYIDGSLCLPIHTLSRALGYYYEDKPELNYTLLRYNNDEYVVKNGIKTRELSYKTETTDFPVYYINGETWVGIRYFGEAIGKTVCYENGTVYIDYRSVIQDIMASNAAKSYAAGILSQFEEECIAGNVYYVAQTPDASDDNPGTAYAPFKTLNKAGEKAKAGDTVIIREGTYREVFTPKNDGTAKNPIIFKAAEGENVVISANEVIDGFLPYGNNGWACAALPKNLGYGRNQIFYKGEGIVEARYPNLPRRNMGDKVQPLSDYFPTLGDFYLNNDNNRLVTSPSGLLDQEEKDIWKGAIYVSGHGQNYTLNQALVESSEKGALHLGKVTGRWWWRPEFSDHVEYGYLQGVEACMDMPGEWIVKNNNLFIIPPEGETAESLVVEAKARQLVANLNDRKFVHLKGIKTIGGSITMDETEMCMLNEMDMSYISHFTWCEDQREGFIDEFSPEHRISGEGSCNRGEVGIWLHGKNNIVLNSNFNHSAGAALFVSGCYAYIEGNFVDSCGYATTYVSGINVYPDMSEEPSDLRGGMSLYENTLQRAGRSLLNILVPEGTTLKGWNGRIAYIPMEIAYNDFHDAILYSLDTGLTYQYYHNSHTDRLWTRVHHNYCYYTQPENNPFSMGMYYDGGSQGYQSFNNVAFLTEKGTSFSHGGIFGGEGDISKDSRNNDRDLKEPIYGGPSNLKENHFPYEKPFYAGLPEGSKTFMKNYERSGEGYIRLLARNAKVSGGAELLENGKIRFKGENPLVVFENVDFGENGYNNIIMYYASEWEKTSNVITIKIGDTFSSAKNYVMLSRSQAYNPAAITTGTLAIARIKGVKNIYISANNVTDNSFCLESLVFENADLGKEGHDGSLVYAGDFDTIDAIGDPELYPRSSITGGVGGPYANYIWTGTQLRYKDVKIPEKCNILMVSAGVREPYDTLEMIFSYQENEDDELHRIGSVRTEAINWSNSKEPYFYTIPEDIKKKIAGKTVDIVMETGYMLDGGRSTADFWHWGLVEDYPEPEATEGSLVSGGAYDSIEKAGNDELKPRRRMATPGIENRYVDRTFGGTVLRYDKIAVPEKAEVFYCNAAADKAGAGQVITFKYRIRGEEEIKKIGDFTTKNIGLETNNKPQYIEIPKKIKDEILGKEIDIFVEFGEISGENAYGNLYNFGFLKENPTEAK